MRTQFFGYFQFVKSQESVDQKGSANLKNYNIFFSLQGKNWENELFAD